MADTENTLRYVKKYLRGWVLAAVLWSNVDAAATTTVIDVPTRGATQRFLHVRPDAPVANIVFLPGSTGILGIADDGSMPTLAGRCAPFARNRVAFAARGFAIALVDQTSDGKIRQHADIREVVHFVRSRDNVPTWIVGGSASARAALRFAVEFPQDELMGVIIFSPASHSHRDVSLAARVKRPALVVYHSEDAPSVLFVDRLFDLRSVAPAWERVRLAGGTDDDCGGHHLFMGIDAEFVAAVAAFIDKHNTMQR